MAEVILTEAVIAWVETLAPAAKVCFNQLCSWISEICPENATSVIEHIVEGAEGIQNINPELLQQEVTELQRLTEPQLNNAISQTTEVVQEQGQTGFYFASIILAIKRARNAHKAKKNSSKDNGFKDIAPEQLQDFNARCDEKSGFGIITLPSGKYEGDFLNDFANGKGTLTISEGQTSERE